MLLFPVVFEAEETLPQAVRAVTARWLCWNWSQATCRLKGWELNSQDGKRTQVPTEVLLKLLPTDSIPLI